MNTDGRGTRIECSINEMQRHLLEYAMLIHSIYIKWMMQLFFLYDFRCLLLGHFTLKILAALGVITGLLWGFSILSFILDLFGQ